VIHAKLAFALARAAIAGDHVRELAGELLLWSSFGIDRCGNPPSQVSFFRIPLGDAGGGRITVAYAGFFTNR
jgi:hypothetical protein